MWLRQGLFVLLTALGFSASVNAQDFRFSVGLTSGALIGVVDYPSTFVAAVQLNAFDARSGLGARFAFEGFTDTTNNAFTGTRILDTAFHIVYHMPTAYMPRNSFERLIDGSLESYPVAPLEFYIGPGVHFTSIQTGQYGPNVRNNIGFGLLIGMVQDFFGFPVIIEGEPVYTLGQGFNVRLRAGVAWYF
jgi:hypothetical protein